MIKTNLLGENIAIFAMCEGRHDCPIDDAIFPNAVPVMAFGKLELMAENKLKPIVDEHKITKLVVYVSGCTPAIIAIINTCLKLKIRELTLMHFDSISVGFQPQKVVMLPDLF